MPPDSYRRKREIDVQTRAVLITLSRLFHYQQLYGGNKRSKLHSEKKDVALTMNSTQAKCSNTSV